MLAKGCIVNGAHTILIDINDQALADTKDELAAISQSEANAVEIATYVYSSSATHFSWNAVDKIRRIKGDLSTEEGINSVVEQIKSVQTSLDALFHCAGIRYMNEIAYTPGDSLSQLEAATKSAPYKGWEHTFRLNVLAPYYLTAGLITLLGQAAAEGEGRGCVVLFSSPASVHNHQFVPVYQTSKAAVDHLVRIMAAEFADFYSKTHFKTPTGGRSTNTVASSSQRPVSGNRAVGNDTERWKIESSTGK
jgi:NAD(P)-dependent dehydrogenase (short-subunit alcohol dehydrogenase family)